ESKPAPKKPTTAAAKNGKKSAISFEDNSQDDGGSDYHANMLTEYLTTVGEDAPLTDVTSSDVVDVLESPF
ncbi:hypothetical protein Tco_0667309, partial [Tanacetum coccineum]